MGWQQEATLMLRTLIFDFADEPEYSDSRLLQLLIVSAKLVNQDVSLDNDYTVSMTSLSITPDPLALEDEEFLGLICLKAACLADQGQYRSRMLLEGIRVSCGPGSLSVSSHLAGFAKLLEEGHCAAYNALVKQKLFGGTSAIRAVMGVFVGNRFDPKSLRSSGCNYDRNMYS